MSNNESNTDFDPQGFFFFFFCAVGWSIKLAKSWDTEN